MISTLPSLRGQSAKDVEGILANLTLEMLPNPGIGARESPLTDELRDRLIREIRIRLGLKSGDNSPRAISRIYEYLSSEMSRAALSEVDIQEIKSRLGQQGDLAPSLYKIEYGDTFKDIHERRGVQRHNVERTLQAPDSVEHLHPDRLGINADKATSLYLKEFRNIKRPSNTYSLLVFCKRSGYVQRVGQAWMIFHSDVDLSRAKTPLDVLKAFIDKYGVEVQVGEKTGKFFWHEKVPLAPNQITNFFGFPAPDPMIDMSACVEPGGIIDGVLQIVYAFGVNHTSYDADLLKHGIRLKPTRGKRPR